MKPEAAKCWEEACSELRAAEKNFDKGTCGCVQELCQSAVLCGCFAIKIGEFGDASRTIFGVCEEVIKLGPKQAIEKTRNTLKTLRQMAPPENYLPEVP